METPAVSVDRGPTTLRELRITPDFMPAADGSVLFELGATRVLCTASITNGVPRRLRGTGQGWLTAEYSLLPGSTSQRSSREAVSGRQGGRTVEIQRLIGRSLRAVTNLATLGERTVYVDCDVIEADGGTRCASISGAYLALHLAFKKLIDASALKFSPLDDSVAAVSVGVVGGMPMLDLDYLQDSSAEVDMNVVMTGSGRLIEVQATAEKVPFDRGTFDQLLDLAAVGILAIGERQTELISQAFRPTAG